MSIRVLTWVFHNSEARKGARLVLLALADYAVDDGSKAYPTIGTLAKKARLSERATRYALRQLEADGAIVRTGATAYGASIYRINMDGEAESAGGSPEAMAGAKRDDGPARLAPKPSEEPSEERSSSAREGEHGEADPLARLPRELHPFVAPVLERLTAVAAAKPAAIAPTAAAVARKLQNDPHKDFIPAAEAYLHWALYGAGRGSKAKDVVRAYANWISKEPPVIRKTLPASGERRPRSSHTEETRRRLAEADL